MNLPMARAICNLDCYPHVCALKYLGLAKCVVNHAYSYRDATYSNQLHVHVSVIPREFVTLKVPFNLLLPFFEYC